jgi:hypothetical protein
VEVKPTDEVVSGLMADIEKARAAKGWKPLTHGMEELDQGKDKQSR